VLTCWLPWNSSLFYKISLPPAGYPIVFLLVQAGIQEEGGINKQGFTILLAKDVVRSRFDVDSVNIGMVSEVKHAIWDRTYSGKSCSYRNPITIRGSSERNILLKIAVSRCQLVNLALP
jgi:hypothetical protein